jgi:ribosome-binding protein aMBF1 (putative translation factor)
MAKERMVTRKVIESKKYKVYQMDGLKLVELDTIEEKGKVSEKELAKKYEVDKVVIDCIEEKKITYGMAVSEFMKYAVVVEDEEKEAIEETADQEQTETK